MFFTHAGDVCESGEEARETADGAAGGAGGGDSRGVRLGRCFTDPSIDMSCHLSCACHLMTGGHFTSRKFTLHAARTGVYDTLVGTCPKTCSLAGIVL
jgi:hypothetical protein